MAKQLTITEETKEISLPKVEFPESIPPETLLTLSENEENGEEVIVTEIPNTIPLSPRAIIDQKAKNAKEARRFPSIPGFNPSLDQLGEWLKLLDDDMWSHLSVYLYRQWPMIVRQMSDPDNPKYIDIITKMQVEDGLVEHIQNTHGGGKYKIWVVDLDQKSAKGKYSTSIMEPTFKIDWNLYEPKLNLKEVDISNKNNTGFVTQMVNKGMMDAKGNILQPSQNGTNGNPAELAGEIGKMYTKVLDMYSKMGTDQQATINKMITEGTSKKDDGGISQLLLEKLKQDDPNKSTATMIAMMTAMKEMQPKQDDSMFKLLITQMQQSAERQMEMMKMMFTQQQQSKEPVPQEDFIDKLVRYRTALPELFGGGGNHREPKKETAEIILDAAKEFGLPVIGLVSQFLQMNKGVSPIVPVTEQQARAMAEQAGAQPSQQALQQQQPQQQRVLQMPKPEPTPPPENEPAKDVVTGQPVLDPNNLTVCQKLLMQYGGMLIKAIKDGMDGATLADTLEGAKPILGDIYGVLAAQGGEEILKAMESIPEFWNQTGKVYGKEHMEQLVADFLIPTNDEDDIPPGAEDEQEQNKLETVLN